MAAAVLTVLMAITGCTSTPDDGRIVTEGGSPTKDARIADYTYYAEQEGDDYRSAAWVDEQECVSPSSSDGIAPPRTPIVGTSSYW